MSVVQMPEVKTSEAKPSNNQSVEMATARRVLETEAAALQKLALFLNDSFLEAIQLIAGAEGRVIVTGIGKSGHVGRKVAATFASTGTPAFFIHPAEASHGDMGMIVRGDVILAISNSGEARELLDIIEYAKRFAIPLIALTSGPESVLATKADVALLLPSVPEACPHGLAPTTSTTMALALGDALAVTLLERKGFTAKDYKIIHPGGKLGQQLMAVSDIMHTGDKVPLAHEDISMAAAIDIITEKGFGCIGLTDDAGVLSGIITDGDLRRHILSGTFPEKAKDLMTRNPKVAMHDMLVAEAMALMNDVKGSYRRILVLLVVDGERKPVGLLHIHDCLRAGFA
jgi:arabinose-5-phosphate isomerase